MFKATLLLQTKLNMPPIRPYLVHRQRLVEKLDAGLTRKLTLVTAPAGYGKTTLVAERFSQHIDKKYAWLSLSEDDNDPTQFWTYVLVALQAIAPDFGRNMLAILREPSGAAAVPITEIINEIMACDEMQDGFVLILDDYHVIDNLSIHEAVTFLLAHMPPTMHLVMTSRADPPLSLARLRVRDQVVEIREADLRFKEVEASEFLNQIMHLELSHKDVVALETRTEGWIAGLQLAALAMQSPSGHSQDRHDFVASFAGSDRYIVDYLVEEVLHQQPPQIQDFLLKTAVLRQLNAHLCDAILDNAQQNAESSQTILELLDQSNLFLLPLDNQRRWYRYHHLFGDLLKYRLQEKYPALVNILNGRASQWYETNGFIEEAVSHALSANDMERAARLIRHSAHDLFSKGKLMTLSNWLDIMLPKNLIYSRQSLYLLQGWIWMRTGKIESCKKLLQHPLPEDEPVDDTVRSEIAYLNANIAYYQGEIEQCIELCQQVQHYLPSGNLPLRMPAMMLLAWGYEAIGQYDQAIDLHREVLQMGQQEESLTAVICSLSFLVHLYAVQGLAAETEATFAQVRQFAEDKGGSHIPLFGVAHIGIGQAHQLQGNYESAEHHLWQGIALSKQWGGLIVYTYRANKLLYHILQRNNKMQDAQMVQKALTHIEQQPEFPRNLWNQLNKKPSSQTQARIKPNLQLHEVLTNRELEILQLMADGLKSPDIADKLDIGVSTVRTHIKHSYVKLDAHSRHEAITRAYEIGLLQ